ncbi:MAG: GtrA family protein [Acidimicrobiales bacterium]
MVQVSSRRPAGRAVDALIERRLIAGKYLAVSAVNLVNHQLLLFLANSIWGWPGGWSNVFAAVLAAVPAYLLSRYWVWEVRGGHSLRGEVIPFWTIALLGLALSTVLAQAADQLFGSGLWVALASLTGYGVVWVVKFAVLDGLFTRSLAADPDGRP